MISGIINAKNEEAWIAQSVASLRAFADEIIVADMQSSDRTREIARAAGARVISVPDYGFVEPAKELALAEATHEWVMMLDADEIVPPSLAVHLVQVASEDVVDGVDIPFKTFMFGRWIAHSGWGPASEVHLRFARRTRLIPPDRTHAVPSLRSDSRVLKLPPEDDYCVRHYNYLGWDHFVNKMNRYTSLEAQHAIQAGKAVRLVPTFRQVGKEIAWRYFRRQGYRDGFAGFLLTLLMVVYRLLVYAKFRQLTDVGDDEAIRRIYRADAASVGVDSSDGGR